MASLKSHPNKATTGIDYVDERSGLYYSKYMYRARLTLPGLNRTGYAKDFLGFQSLIKRQLNSYKGTSHHSRVKDELSQVNMPSIERFLTYRDTYAKGKNKDVMIRIESNTAGIFSNNMSLLKQIESIAPGIGIVDYTEIDQSIPQGIKYYVEEPKHKYRVYVKSKRIEDATKDGLRRFIDRYKDTDTVIVPSGAFKEWLDPNKKSTWYWSNNYMSSHYFLDFDQESTDTLFALMFGDLIHRRFKLEKRPE